MWFPTRLKFSNYVSFAKTSIFSTSHSNIDKYFMFVHPSRKSSDFNVVLLIKTSLMLSFGYPAKSKRS